MKVYALNLFNIADRDEYLATAGDIEPRLADLHPHRVRGTSK